MFNNNIGCIETTLIDELSDEGFGLITTQDVLKPDISENRPIVIKSLITTQDVLKPKYLNA